jgi:AcrR family transcriptional regulator
VSRARTYELKQRAERMEETRRRITEAAVELHGTVGPARTTMSEIARRAGVERVTVYRHFPTESELFRACSSHWAASNPPPNANRWFQPRQPPQARLRRALTELYAYYANAEPTLTNVTRDAETMPALHEVGERRRRYLAEIEARLAKSYPAGGKRGERVRAALGLALDFRTWKYLTRERGLDDQDVINLMTTLVEQAASSQTNASG